MHFNKTISCLLVALLLSWTIKAQDEYTYSRFIEGLGELKIGTTTTELVFDYALSSKRKVVTIGGGIKVTSKSPFIYESKPKDGDCVSWPQFAGHRYFELPRYKIMGKYLIPVLILEFYNDTLYRISMADPPSQLVEDLKIKYGNGASYSFDSPCTCYMGDERFEMRTEWFGWTWKTGNIEMSIDHTIGRQKEGCKKVYDTDLSITQNTVAEEVVAGEKTAAVICDQAKKEKRRKQLEKL